MNLVEHENDGDGNRMKVWLELPGEVEQLLDAAEDTEQRIAFGLGAWCGLRSKEWLDVEPRHIEDTEAGKILRVPEGKGAKYREVPIPESLASTIVAVGDVGGGGPDSPVIRSASSTRTLRKWIKRARERLAEENDDERWRHLSTHDLRRTWGNALDDQGVSAMMAINWGGWEDLETFREHYQGAYSPAAQRREREKVEWL